MSSTTRNQYNPDYVSPPGETLLEVLEERGMSQAELAERTGRPRKTISEIINGKTAITPDTALQLERTLGVPAHFWNQREQNYQDFLAREREKKKLEGCIEWLDRFPIKAMVKLGWINSSKHKIEQLQILLNFFAVASPEQWDKLWSNQQVAYRKSVAFVSDGLAISVWLRKGEISAERVTCASYNATKFKKALEQIRALTVEPPQVFQPKLVQLCAEAGVVVVFVPELPKTRVSGVTRWLTANKALIQLSLRYKSDDHLWFTFFHEAKHVLQELKTEMFLEGQAEYDPTHPMEKDANNFAANFLIPEAELNDFLALHKRRYSKAAIAQFAAEIGIAPGIVVGRLQHDQHLPRNHCNDLKRHLAWA
jgi:HTH-type transcriptional regulator / antitoxin HigA